MSREVAVVDNEELDDEDENKHIQSLCPVNRKGEECITVDGEDLFIDEDLCIGCGICVNAKPEAIKIVNLPEKLDKDPIHRYGRNEFELFSLPIPVFNKVVGVIGQNGLGKSTGIKILSQILEPNLGDWESDETGFDELMDYFSGSEMQRFLNKLKKGEIEVSYKPQQVSEIPKKYEGKVKDLLEKSDERGELEKVSKELQLENILDNNLSDVSGGELQRIAIAATALKDANLYIFDEPMSYLDIKQRLNISKFIRSLTDEDTAVTVVEHDLIILDYIADLIQLMYGEPSAYGIVSDPITSKKGINTFLSGYLQDQNIRFRDYSIEFKKSSEKEVKKDKTVCSWKNLEKTLGDFTLNAEEGEIYQNEIVGVMGENGIGKTTFVKLLASKIKPDEGEISTVENISYKPQYLENKGDEPVASILQEAVNNYDKTLIKPLDIDNLMDKKISELSGGELQRVAIAESLSKEADLYLLDEPSAYLDIEQRLNLSNVLNDFIERENSSIIVVDHDLLFLDYLSNRLLLFKGEPSIKGETYGPYKLKEGMNKFLENVGITFRREPNTGRPRANKPGSVKDRKQKKKNQYYYEE